MEDNIIKWRNELREFEKKDVFKHILERRHEQMRSRMSQLIDFALKSSDERVMRVAQSLKEEGIFWREWKEITGTDDLLQVEHNSPQIVEKMYRDLDDPLEAETQVVLGTAGGTI